MACYRAPLWNPSFYTYQDQAVPPGVRMEVLYKYHCNSCYSLRVSSAPMCSCTEREVRPKVLHTQKLSSSSDLCSSAWLQRWWRSPSQSHKCQDLAFDSVKMYSVYCVHLCTCTQWCLEAHTHHIYTPSVYLFWGCSLAVKNLGVSTRHFALRMDSWYVKSAYSKCMKAWYAHQWDLMNLAFCVPKGAPLKFLSPMLMFGVSWLCTRNI